MAPEIPGYYFDPVKKKYFNIEKSHTAPPSAAWSSDEVKRRRVDDAAAESARRRARLLRNHIQRCGALQSDVVARARLLREVGEKRTGGSNVAVVEDLTATAWAGGLVDKGSIPFVPSFARARYANMPCLYVGGDDVKTGLGVAYATLDEETLVGSYIATDDNDAPLLSDEDDWRPQWLLGETSHYQRLYIRHRLRDEWLVHQSTPAPASSDLLCVIGTNAGILRVRSNETMAWISSAPSSSSSSSSSSAPQGKHVPQEVFDQDFQTGNANVLLAGGRQARLWLTDLRAPEVQWCSVPHASSIAHLRSISEHQILVAGLRSSMCVYDMRFFGRKNPNQNQGGQSQSQSQSRSQSQRQKWTPNGSTPVLTFDGYKNEAHVHTGWDVCRELGLVAAAHDDGTVKLFSLRSGRMLTGGGGGVGGIKADTPVRALMFQTMPRETMPSLFVGEGPLLRKFSLGVGEVGDEA
ncbi:hypothetical protein PWT90_08033 [Aphanocladium album]|nr:hypothetical protein PWT90_08033 [Aphanocladium album]